ncbi:uncharacterized protein EV420DRAFT_1583616 [Desarmillaria tabescens]|uniref:C2H2-type domain-containing protein n=1 Tax=Armillaria tabescens TaxID=1929756 RepID=A0AA39JBX6_ARMTA|nr:uncharacterized protein EV420DRAFT_1583616 [Desarmillaria tabescens]KAK0439514.1 hypothetical protein EV420DRAFT_1583616 [Desarmillaria tabescens]
MVAVATELRPFPCPKCNLSFTKHHDLKRHRVLHLSKEAREAAKYPCKFADCKHKTLQLSNLKIHMNKVHYNKKNKKCPDPACNYRTADSSELTRHRIDIHKYVPPYRLPRQKPVPRDDSMFDDDSTHEDKDKDAKDDVDMESADLAHQPPSMTSSSSAGSSMALDTPPPSHHNANVDFDIDVPVTVFPLPPPSPVSMGSRHSMSYTPPPHIIASSAPVCFSSPPRKFDSDMPSPARSSPCRSMIYTPSAMDAVQADDIYLPLPPRSPSLRPSMTSTLRLGLPAELFITGPSDCQLRPIMCDDELDPTPRSRGCIIW